MRPAGRATNRLRAAGVVVVGCAELVAGTVLAGCTIGPSSRPALATSGAPGAVDVPATSRTVPLGPGGPGRTSDPITWTTCPSRPADDAAPVGTTVTVRCGTVRVPRSYTDANSGVFPVFVSKAVGATTPADAPPLLVVQGGPGENGTDRAAAVAGALPAALLDHFSVLVMDLRGTGQSEPINCVSGGNSRAMRALGADPTTPAAAELIADLSRSLTLQCADVVGTELSDYSTVLAADDIDTVRAALGAPKIALLGQGFGATLGAVYADRYPGRVDRAVLDGPTDPAVPPDQLAVATAIADEKALSEFAAACPTFPGGCRLGSDPAAAVHEEIKALGDVGVPTSDGAQVTGGSVLLALTIRLGSPASWPALADTLESVRTGNADPLAALLDEPAGSTVEQQQTGRLAFQCNDASQRLGGARLAEAAAAARSSAPTFGPFLVGLAGLCSSWPASETPLGPVTADGAPPILVLGAVDDPIAPYSAVRSLTAQLHSATLLSWQSGVHGAFPASRCATTAVQEYLLSGTVPAIGTLCPP